MDADLRRKIMGENADRLYGWRLRRGGA